MSAAAIAIGREVLRGCDQVGDVAPQDLTNFVSGFGKRPEETTSRQAIVAVANEILCRVAQLCQFTE